VTKNEGWPTFSFTEFLTPSEGWRTDCAILSTYSADLIVIVTALLALTGSDLDSRRTGSRVEFVKAIEALRGRVSVLAQAGRLAIPNTPRSILKLLDKFVKTVDTNETIHSWHPKIALVRYQQMEDAADSQWRVWIGSRNLTRALNWEAGLTLTSRSDGKGQVVDGLPEVGQQLALRANLAMLPAKRLRAELSRLTWECPPGCDVHRVSLLGPGLSKGLPTPPSDTDQMFVISPYLDAKTVRAASAWGGEKTRRTLVSTAIELRRLLNDDIHVFKDFADLRTQPIPDLPAEGAVTRDEGAEAPIEAADSEEVSPAGLHAKLLFAAKGTRRQLWVGSANATERGWHGRNFEGVAELTIARNVAEAIEDFVSTCEPFILDATPPKVDLDEEALEEARKFLSFQWALRQQIGDDELKIHASTTPPLADPTIELEVAALGGAWTRWPPTANSLLVSGQRRWQRSDFVQIRVSRGDRMCAWLQIAPCDPPPDEERDHALIAQYLDPRTFLLWIRSLLADEPARAAGGDWDAEPRTPVAAARKEELSAAEIGILPTVEEILRSWARDSSAFAAADEKVKAYLKELERRAGESGVGAEAHLLNAFRQTWETLAKELR
jgi:hypothetical protein